MVFEIITDLASLLELENRRVEVYLRNFVFYDNLGYSPSLRFPPGVDPSRGLDGNPNLREIVEGDVCANYKLYWEFAYTAEGLSEQLKACLRVAKEFFGIYTKPPQIAPTLYGTIGSPTYPCFVRIPRTLGPGTGENYSTGSPPTLIETIVHEALAHIGTKKLRNKTPLADKVTALGHFHKERLMDLITAGILSRAGVMGREQVAMQRLPPDVCQLVDCFFYNGWRGNLRSLIDQINNELAHRLHT
ncbi:MAG: hypothetical protein QXY45_02545 [Candidatus Aenigmatarchaeota archaeon]